MKILIAGKSQTGQKEVVERLTKHTPEGSLAGFTMDHTFENKYYTVKCGIWVDEIDELKDWVQEFSGEEAREVRDALALFIYTFDAKNPTDHKDIQGLGEFNDLLKPGISLAIPYRDNSDESLTLALEESGFDTVELDELVPVVQSALYDAQSEAGPDDFSGEVDDDNADLAGEHFGQRPPRDFDEILQELIAAKTSTTMTNEEKKALASRLAEELI